MTRGIQGIELGPYYNDNMTMKKERKLTAAEKKKREEVAKAIERDNPGMDMSRKMAIATATAKKSTNEEVPGNAVGQGGVNMAPNMGPRVKAISVTDRRRRKDKQPVMLKRFRTFVDEK